MTETQRIREEIMVVLDRPDETLVLREPDRTELMAIPIRGPGNQVLEVELTIDHPDASGGGSIPIVLDATKVFRLQRWLAKVYLDMLDN